MGRIAILAIRTLLSPTKKSVSRSPINTTYSASSKWPLQHIQKSRWLQAVAIRIACAQIMFGSNFLTVRMHRPRASRGYQILLETYCYKLTWLDSLGTAVTKAAVNQLPEKRHVFLSNLWRKIYWASDLNNDWARTITEAQEKPSALEQMAPSTNGKDGLVNK